MKFYAYIITLARHSHYNVAFNYESEEREKQ